MRKGGDEKRRISPYAFVVCVCVFVSVCGAGKSKPTQHARSWHNPVEEEGDGVEVVVVLCRSVGRSILFGLLHDHVSCVLHNIMLVLGEWYACIIVMTNLPVVSSPRSEISESS